MKNRAKILTTAIMLQLVVMALTTTVKAQTTNVSVLPSSITIPNVGDTAVVDVNITDVTNLFAYEIKIWFLNSVLNVSSANVVRPTGHILEPVDPANQFIPKWEINATYNATHGRIWLSFTLLAPETGRSGNGIITRITFTGIGLGTTPIVLNNSPGSGGPVKLADTSGLPIAHTATDGSIEVIPEFPVFLLLPILSITSAVAVSFVKLYRRKKT